MSERAMRKRPVQEAVELGKGDLAKRAALEVLKGMHNGSVVRVAATFYDLSNPSHIQYYVRKWKDSELVTARMLACDPHAHRPVETPGHAFQP